MLEKDFIPKPYTNLVENGSFTWSSPSNIALVKYWGKKAQQIPENPSISFTLDNCKTTTKLSFTKRESDNNFSFEVFLDDEKKERDCIGTDFWYYDLNTSDMKDGVHRLKFKVYDIKDVQSKHYDVRFILDRKVPLIKVNTITSGAIVSGKLKQTTTIVIEMAAMYPTYLNNVDAVSFPSFFN